MLFPGSSASLPLFYNATSAQLVHPETACGLQVTVDDMRKSTPMFAEGLQTQTLAWQPPRFLQNVTGTIASEAAHHALCHPMGLCELGKQVCRGRHGAQPLSAESQIARWALLPCADVSKSFRLRLAVSCCR